MSFLKHFAVKTGENIFQSFTQLLVEFDPETASEAQIGVLNENLDKMTKQMVGAKADYDKEQAEATQIRANYDLGLRAAEKLQSMLAKETDANKASQIESSLAKQMDKLEGMLPDVEREEQEALEAKEFYEELKKATENAAQLLKSARDNLSNAKRRMEHAAIKEKRAKEQSERAEVLAGIKKQTSSLGVAFDVMNAKAAKHEQAAEAAKVKAQLLSKPTEEEDPILAAALAEAAGKSPTSGSLSERLAALKAKK